MSVEPGMVLRLLLAAAFAAGTGLYLLSAVSTALVLVVLLLPHPIR